jgi:hypothetical protein
MAAHAHTSDPIDNAGLFVGRRAGALAVPVGTPAGEGSTLLTRGFDHALALVLLLLEVVLVASVWGPQPIAWLWVASQVSYLAGSVVLGLLAGFIGMLASLWLTLLILTRIDHAWKLTRRAAGCDQREGCLERLFVAATILVVPAFLVWLFVIEGPGSFIFPLQAG